MNDPLPKTKKSLGQHWLYDKSALLAIGEAADIQSGDTVLEIGPGLGNLTQILADKAGQVIAVELDEKLARELPGRVKTDNLEVVSQDILRFDLTRLPADYKVVANIPYYLTGNLVRVLSESANPPACAVLLVQKEVAERITASPGSMSVLAVTAQFYWKVSLGVEVPSRLFTPPPKVDSQVVILRRRIPTQFAGVQTKDFFRLVKAGFSARRKTLLNSLSAGLRAGKDTIVEALMKADISPSARPQTLSLDDWYRLYQTLRTSS